MPLNMYMHIIRRLLTISSLVLAHIWGWLYLLFVAMHAYEAAKIE